MIKFSDALSHMLRLAGRTTRILSPQLKVTKKHWKARSQRGEYDFHAKNTWRQTEEFMIDNEALFRHFGFSPADFSGQLIIDLGAGSRLRSKFFHQAEIYAIEPLADQFISGIEW